MRFLKMLTLNLIGVLAISTLFTASSTAQSVDQKVLTNSDVLEMLKGGLPPEIVAAKIKSSHCNFATEMSDLKTLRDGGVPDNVVLAMVQAAHYAVVPSDGKIRVFVTDSQSWEMHGGWGAANGSGGGSESGGARPQTAEIIKTFSERCPEVLVTNKQDIANYAVTLDHEGGKGALRKDNKVAVFRRDGDSILGKSTRELGNSVKDACAAILADAKSQTKK